ncbi:MAG: hypothetical protein J6X46_03450, partial [Prevotella sp.]|nr:hypothetical protein [Prevotella sp.]
MSLPDISIRVLTPETDLTAFKCAEGDLNEFLLDESKDYQTEYLAVTYLLVNSENGDIIAYYSLLNDVVRLNETEKSVSNGINRKIPFSILPSAFFHQPSALFLLPFFLLSHYTK